MVKNRDEVRRDVLDMCGWVQDSYQLPENFFLEQFHKLLGYISKTVNSRNRINEKIIFLHVNNTEEICDLMHSFFD